MAASQQRSGRARPENNCGAGSGAAGRSVWPSARSGSTQFMAAARDEGDDDVSSFAATTAAP